MEYDFIPIFIEIKCAWCNEWLLIPASCYMSDPGLFEKINDPLVVLHIFSQTLFADGALI
jgi:hypothetical protein